MHNNLFLAGTFDGLHAGHRFLLTRAFAEGVKVTIGLTSDEFVKKFKLQSVKCKVRTYEERKKVLEQWLNNHTKHATIISINDPYEPAASMPDLDAIVVTAENKNRGEYINALRQGIALSPLAFIEVPMQAAEDGKPVSSTRLRNGEIDADGRLVMPESMRTILATPLGTVLEGVAVTASIERSGKKIIITVGDIATKTLLDAGVMPALSIIDGKVGRKPFHETLKLLQLQKVKPFSLKTVKSGPGYMSREAINTIRSSFASDTGLSTEAQALAENQRMKEHHVLIINGEEDLLVLPAVEYAPVGSIVYYGQPRIASRDNPSGLVEVIVTEEKKREVAVLLARFLSYY